MDNYSRAVRFPTCKVCGWCGRAKPADGGDKLKRCGGCSVVLYCSKKCQTEAWPTHRDLCGSKTKEEAAELGYSSMASIANTLDCWVNAHEWSLRTIVEATAHKTGGGIDDLLKNQCAVKFVLSLGNPDPSDPSNPAKAFVLEEGGIVRRLERDSVDGEWSLLESTCRNMAAAMRANLPEAERRAFAGFLPAVLHFPTAGKVVLFNDVVQVCAEYVNQGLALRAPGGDYNQPLPDVGSYRRLKKSWIWVRWPDWEWDTFSTGDTVPKSAAETLRLYHRLLAQRS
ncbi:hypothetical protein LXA43DRAFT_1123963 [Ganoderma leucocontextum]|nr:hypothetical protein LXA43DRAFT_1123963 [Ganoderma leucocontextum]